MPAQNTPSLWLEVVLEAIVLSRDSINISSIIWDSVFFEEAVEAKVEALLFGVPPTELNESVCAHHLSTLGSRPDTGHSLQLKFVIKSKCSNKRIA